MTNPHFPQHGPNYDPHGGLTPVPTEALRGMLRQMHASQQPAVVRTAFEYLGYCVAVTSAERVVLHSTQDMNVTHTEVKEFPGRELDNMEAKVKMASLDLLRKYFDGSLKLPKDQLGGGNAFMLAVPTTKGRGGPPPSGAGPFAHLYPPQPPTGTAGAGDQGEEEEDDPF